MTDAIATTNPSHAKRQDYEPDFAPAITRMLTASEAPEVTAPDRSALIAYSSWLYYERAFLCQELYPQLGHKAAQFIVGGNSGFNYHDKARAAASTRAMTVMSAVGCDTRGDTDLGCGECNPAAPEGTSFPHPDAYLLDLEREFLERHAAYNAVRQGEIAAHAEFDRREAPFAEADDLLLKFPPAIGPSGKMTRTFWPSDEIRQALHVNRCMPPSSNTTELERLLPLVEARETRILELKEELRFEEWEESAEEALFAADAVANRIYRLRAQTFEGLALKARVLKITDPELWKQPAGTASWHTEPHERALAEIADGVEQLLTHGVTTARTPTRADRADLVLARRVRDYFGKRPSPELEGDQELWDLAQAVLERDDRAFSKAPMPRNAKTIAEAIGIHRREREALNLAAGAQDEVEVEELGGDTSPAAMEAAGAAFSAQCAIEDQAWATLLKTRPRGFDELLDQIRYVAGSSAYRDHPSEGQAILDRVADDIEALCAVPPATGTGQSVNPPLRTSNEEIANFGGLPDPRWFAFRITRTDQSVAELRALHDVADLIAEFALAVTSQDRCLTGIAYPERHLNVAGGFANWVYETARWVQGAAFDTARVRNPANGKERQDRLNILANSAINNGDRDETAKFIRDLSLLAGV